MVNCYLEAAPPGSKTQAAIPQAFGVVDWSTVGTGPLRGGIVINGVPYVVSGNGLYSVARTGIPTLLGTIPNDDIVSIAGDGTNVMVATQGDGYLWDGTSLAQITDPDFPRVSKVDFLDGYAVIVELDSGRVWVNETPYVWSSWNALDFATAERSPDDIVSQIIDHREVFLFGRDSTEVWENRGGEFPLQPVGPGMIEVGCMSKFGPAKIDNSVCFPGSDGIVYRMDGYTPIRISNHGVEQAIESLADKTMYGMTWAEGGHKFYGLTSSNWTFVYDFSTQLWHERQSFGLNYWKPRFVLRAYDMWLAGDSLSNKIGRLDPQTFTEFGSILRSSCTSGAIESENKWIFHERLELVFEEGVGLESGQGSDPKVMVDWSNDGGRTWSAEKWRSMGKTGEFKNRVCVDRLGRARDRVYRYAVTDPVRRTLVKATLEAKVGAA